MTRKTPMQPQASPSYLLLVEDSADDAFFFKRSAALAGVGPLVHVEDGEAAKKLLSTAKAPALIVTDLKMPRCCGMELLTWICTQPRLKDTQVVVLSASGAEEDKRRALAAGAKEYLVKPSQVNEYRSLWERLLPLLSMRASD